MQIPLIHDVRTDYEAPEIAEDDSRTKIYCFERDDLYVPGYPVFRYMSSVIRSVSTMAQSIKYAAEYLGYDAIILSFQGTSGAIVASLLARDLLSRKIRALIGMQQIKKRGEIAHRYPCENYWIAEPYSAKPRKPLNLFVDDFVSSGMTRDNVVDGALRLGLGPFKKINGACVLGEYRPRKGDEVVICQTVEDPEFDYERVDL